MNSAKQILTKIQDVQTLVEKTEHILGSIAYISNEYDKIFDKMSKSNKLGQKIKKDMEQIGRRQNFIEKQIDHLEQYGRRENLEILGVLPMKNENTNHIVKTVTKMSKVKVEDEPILTSHHLPVADQKTDLQNGEKKHSTQPLPPIIVRLSNRDERNGMFRQKNSLTIKSVYSSTFGNAELHIRENLTRNRKMLYHEARTVKQELNFMYL